MDSRTVREGVGKFLELYSSLYHRPATRYDVVHVLSAFEEFARVRAKRAPLVSEVTRDDVAAYQAHQLGRRRSTSTVNRHVRTIKTFFRWSARQGWRRGDPTEGMRPLKVSRRKPALPDAASLAKLLEHLKATGDVKYGSLVIFAANTGLRLGELVWVRLEDVDLEARTLRVRNDAEHRTKDDDERTIPLNERAWKIARFWVDRRRSEGGRLLFYPERPPRYLCALWRGLQRRIVAAGCKPFGWHALRHLFATKLASIVTEPVLAALLGHSDPRTTRRWYVHAAGLSVPVPPVI